jgi:hypothetical protein
VYNFGSGSSVLGMVSAPQALTPYLADLNLCITLVIVQFHSKMHGPYINNKMHGPYNNNKMHGPYNNNKMHGPYNNNKMHGPYNSNKITKRYVF